MEGFSGSLRNVVRVMKLKSGEEIMATITEYPDSYKIENPVQMVITPDGRIATLAFMPYTNAAKGLTIPKDSVLFLVEAKQELEDNYKTAMGKIITPSSKVLLND